MNYEFMVDKNAIFHF